jgi:hypothetical protein
VPVHRDVRRYHDDVENDPSREEEGEPAHGSGPVPTPW